MEHKEEEGEEGLLGGREKDGNGQLQKNNGQNGQLTEQAQALAQVALSLCCSCGREEQRSRRGD
eukprot:2850780-Rhodomonas_salina.1